MDALAERFQALQPLFQPKVYEPENPTGELNMITYVVPVPLLLNHGKATNNTVKTEFHFELDLPPAETVSGNVGPTQRTIRARLPQLPYQFVLKLMTLAASPVGIDEERRGGAIPRQLYDLDILLASFANSGQWEAMVAYCSARYARECETWTIDVAAGEPIAGIRDRLQRWASCSDSSSERWRTIRAVQQSQLRQRVHREPWGWRARCLRLALAVECIDAEDGWAIWQQALATARLVPASRARRFRDALAELAKADTRSLPLELHDFVWEALSNGGTPLAERVANAYATLSRA